MAAELITPIDEDSGLPCPIAPKCEWLPLNRPDKADTHHSWHPRNSPLLKTVAGMALRNSFLQVVERELHNEGPLRYHGIFLGPPLPEDETKIFKLCVLACAGIIPDRVIDLTADDPTIPRRVTQKEAEFLRVPSPDDSFGYRYIKYRYEPIRDFFREYALRQDLTHISSSRIDEFLFTNDLERRVKIGRFLLNNAVALAGDNVRGEYAEKRRKGLLHPAMPEDPRTLVHYKLGTQERRDELIPRLAEQLTRAA